MVPPNVSNVRGYILSLIAMLLSARDVQYYSMSMTIRSLLPHSCNLPSTDSSPQQYSTVRLFCEKRPETFDIYWCRRAYPAAFKDFTDLPQTFDALHFSNLTDFTMRHEIDARNPTGSRGIFVTATFDLANQTRLDISGVKNLTFSLSFQPLP